MACENGGQRGWSPGTKPNTNDTVYGNAVCACPAGRSGSVCQYCSDDASCGKGKRCDHAYKMGGHKGESLSCNLIGATHDGFSPAVIGIASNYQDPGVRVMLEMSNTTTMVGRLVKDISTHKIGVPDKFGWMHSGVITKFSFADCKTSQTNCADVEKAIVWPSPAPEGWQNATKVRV